MDMQPNEHQQRAGASKGKDFNVTMPTDEPFKITGNKYIILAGNKIKAHEDIRNVFQCIPGLEEVTSVEKCDVIVVLCTIVSRAGTDIETVLNELNRLSDSKPAIFVVLHHIFDPNKVVQDSSKCVDRPNTLTVDLLFYEDEGLLKCTKDKEALDKIQQCMLPKIEQNNTLYNLFFYVWDTLKQQMQNVVTHFQHYSQNDMIASELMIVLLGMSGTGKDAVGNMIFGREEMCEAGVSTATQKITVENGNVNGEKLSVIDTPDWFNFQLSLEKLKENIQSCISMCSSRPYAVLLVIPVKKFTVDEGKMVENMVEKMKTIFEEGCWEKVMILFFTDDEKKQNIESFIQQQKLKKLVDNCGYRFDIAQKETSTQGLKLLEKIKEMVSGRKESSDICELTGSAVFPYREQIDEDWVKIDKK